MAEGEFALVRQMLETALQTPAESIGDHDLYAMLVDAAVQQRDEAAIRRYARRAEDLAAHYGHTLYQAIAERGWGVAHRLAGAYAEAELRLMRALELFERLPTRWQIGRTRVELGELALAQGDADKAREHFDAARAAVKSLHARRAAEPYERPKA